MTTNSVECFLDEVCTQIRWRRWRAPIRAELHAHLEDRMEYLVTQRGFSHQEAEQEAVAAMGDPSAIGKMLDRQHRPILFYGYLAVLSAILIFFLYLIYCLL